MSTAVFMWWPITSNMPEFPRLSYPLQMLYLFLLSIAQIIVSAPIVFSTHPLYQWYVDAPRVWGVTPTVDQQIGAIIMKVGGTMLLGSLIVITFFRWYRTEEVKTATEKVETEHYSTH
jgi:putative membrane protein